MCCDIASMIESPPHEAVILFHIERQASMML